MKRILMLLILLPVTVIAADNTLFWEPSSTTDVTDYRLYAAKRSKGSAIYAPYSVVTTLPATTAKVACPAPSTLQCYRYIHTVPDDKAEWSYYATSIRYTGTPDEEESAPSNPAVKSQTGKPAAAANLRF